MKAVMLSLRPQWCEKIFNGSKSIEVRKSRPSLDMPFRVYVYQTKIKFKVKNWQENFQSIVFTPNGGVEEGNGKVIGSFVCDRIDEYTFSDYEARYRINDVDIAKTCLNHPELIAYGKGKPLYGWHITEPKLFDKPRELSEFGKVCNRYENDECDDCPYLQVYVNSYPCDDCVDTWCGVDNIKPLTRPPQSWCYVEELQ